MDINNIALIILTAFINLAVTNYIFYRYQKKIEDTFAKSMLEFQTKFVRGYEKTAETLENLYRKSIDMQMDMDIVCKKLSGAMLESISYPDLHRSLTTKVIDFRDYYSANQLYLPQDILGLIQDIHVLNTLSGQLLFIVIMHIEEHIPTEETLNSLSALIEKHNSVLKKTYLTSDLGDKHIKDVFWDILDKMEDNSESLKKMYQSLAKAIR